MTVSFAKYELFARVWYISANNSQSPDSAAKVYAFGSFSILRNDKQHILVLWYTESALCREIYIVLTHIYDLLSTLAQLRTVLHSDT